MKKVWIIFTALSIVAGGAAGIVASLGTESYLESYARAIESISVPPRLGEERARSTSVSYQESLGKIRENVLPTIVRWHRAIPTSSAIARGSYFDDQAIGSGVIISSDGWVMTTQDVFSQAQAGNVVAVVGARVYNVVETRLDNATDMMLVKINAENLPVISFGESSNLAVGDGVFVAESNEVFGVSYVKRVDTSKNIIEPSESLSGRVILSDEFNESNIVANSSGEIVGIIDGGEVQPFKALYPAIQQVLRGGEIERPRLGLRVAMLDQAVGHEMFGQGALVVERPAYGTPARKAGIEIGDVVLRVNGSDVGGWKTLGMLMLDYRAGDIISLRIKRGDVELDVDVELDQLP